MTSGPSRSTRGEWRPEERAEAPSTVTSLAIENGRLTERLAQQKVSLAELKAANTQLSSDNASLREQLERVEMELRGVQAAYHANEERTRRLEKTIHEQSTLIRSGGTKPPTQSSRPSDGRRQSGSRDSARPTPPLRSPHTSASRKQVAIQAPAGATELTSGFASVFSAVEGWSRTFCNAPNKLGFDHLPPSTQQALQECVKPATASRVLNDSTARFWVVARLANTHLTSYAFRPLLLRGFSSHHDGQIGGFRKELNSTQMEIHKRRALLEACAQTCEEMKGDDSFPKFLNKVVDRRAEEMWQLLGPLVSAQASPVEAKKKLRVIWAEAAELGTQILLRPCQHRFDYPVQGPATIYNPAQMTNRDTSVPQPQGACVRLAITPVITEMDFFVGGMRPKVLHHAHVLLLQRRETARS